MPSSWISTTHYNILSFDYSGISTGTPFAYAPSFQKGTEGKEENTVLILTSLEWWDQIYTLYCWCKDFCLKNQSNPFSNRWIKWDAISNHVNSKLVSISIHFCGHDNIFWIVFGGFIHFVCIWFLTLLHWQQMAPNVTWALIVLWNQQFIKNWCGDKPNDLLIR